MVVAALAFIVLGPKFHGIPEAPLWIIRVPENSFENPWDTRI